MLQRRRLVRCRVALPPCLRKLCEAHGVGTVVDCPPNAWTRSALALRSTAAQKRQHRCAGSFPRSTVAHQDLGAWALTGSSARLTSSPLEILYSNPDTRPVEVF